ncbi:hypothetical protein [Streptomyces sp. NPDC001292]
MVTGYSSSVGEELLVGLQDQDLVAGVRVPLDRDVDGREVLGLT